MAGVIFGGGRLSEIYLLPVVDPEILAMGAASEYGGGGKEQFGVFLLTKRSPNEKRMRSGPPGPLV